jgi:hypothetical protein
MIRPESLYLNTPKCLVVLFDLRYPGAEERLQREQAAWRGFARAEVLTAGHSGLIIWPGAATRLAS